MAKNWLAYEAANVLLKGTDKASLVDIGSRFPLFSNLVVRDGSESLVDILKAIPKVTARMVEMGLKGTDTEEAEDTDTVEEAEVKKPAKKAVPAKKASPKKKAEPEEDEEESDNPYEGKSAVELYKMCKERGLSVKTKLKASDYAKALMEADAEVETEEEEDEEDWEEEPAPKKKPAKKAAAKPKKKPAKVEEDDDEEEDSDDDWEI